jgi:hypothetical protein
VSADAADARLEVWPGGVASKCDRQAQAAAGRAPREGRAPRGAGRHGRTGPSLATPLVSAGAADARLEAWPGGVASKCHRQAQAAAGRDTREGRMVPRATHTAARCVARTSTPSNR